MEQQQTLPQFRVSLSLRTKLLLSTVILLLAVIVFLNLSTIFLLRDDKRAYTYQSQAVEAALSGRQLVTVARHSLDTLRGMAASIDPNREPTPAERTALQNMIANQSDLVEASVGLFDLKTGSWKEVAHGAKADDLKAMGVADDQLAVTGDALRPLFAQLQTSAFAFFNLSEQAKVPVIGVVFADLRMLSNPNGVPLVVGAISMQGFNSQSSNETTVATRTGQLLFDSDSAKLYGNLSIADDPLIKSSKETGVANGTLEFEDKGTRYLGSFALPGFDLIILSRAQYQRAMKATYTMTEKFILLGTMAITAAIIFALFFSRSITAPLRKLYEGTQEVAAGNFGQEVQVQSEDEIGALTHSFNFMSKKIVKLLEDSVAKVRLDNELAIASTVQQTLIPPDRYEDARVKIMSHYASASECGGDWWGFFGTGQKMAIMIADATGHGLPSALITASARSCFSVLNKLAEEDPEFTYSPSAMLSYANRVIYDASLGKIMMTFFIAVVDFEKRTLTYSCAGHNPPWLFKKAGGVESLIASGQRCGESKVMPEAEEKTTQFSSGDLLLLYTDGLLEGTNAEGEQFGKKRSRKISEANASAGPDALIKNLMTEFNAHNGGKPYDDDVTLAAVQMS